jgi:acetyl-CoA carboxylase biotin carboxyl carrier protein
MPEKKDGLFDIGEIRQILELMKEFNVSHFNLSQSGQRLSLRRAGFAEPPVVATPSVVAGPVQPAVANVVAPSPEASEKEPDYIKTVKSPMVGVFYASSSPEGDPFVKIDDVVKPKTIVCIIEAMKVFNEIPAEVAGKIVEILVENGSPVEYGTPLFKIDAR